MSKPLRHKVVSTGNLNRALTPKEAAFVDAYMVNGCNYAEAFVAAGFKKLSTTGATDSAIARVRRRPRVAYEIEKRQEKARSYYGCTVDFLVRELMKIAQVNVGDYHEIVGRELVPNFTNVTLDQMAALSEVTTDRLEGGDGPTVIRTKVRTHDKIGAITQLAKMMGLLHPQKSGDDGKVEVVGGLPAVED